MGKLVNDPNLGKNGILDSKYNSARVITAGQVLQDLKNGDLRESEKSYLYSTRTGSQAAVACALCKCQQNGVIFKKIKEGGNNFFTHPGGSRKRCQKYGCPCNTPTNLRTNYRIRNNPVIEVSKSGSTSLVVRISIHLPNDSPIDQQKLNNQIKQEWGLTPTQSQGPNSVLFSFIATNSLPEFRFKHTNISGNKFLIRVDGFDFSNKNRNRIWGKKFGEDEYIPLQASESDSKMKISGDLQSFTKILFVSQNICQESGKHNGNHWHKYPSNKQPNFPDISRLCLGDYGNICYASKINEWRISADSDQTNLHDIMCRELSVKSITETKLSSKISLLHDEKGEYLFHNSQRVRVKIIASRIDGFSDSQSEEKLRELIDEESSHSSSEYTTIVVSEGIEELSLNLRANQKFGIRVRGNLVLEFRDQSTNQILFRCESRGMSASQPTVRELSLKKLDSLFQKYRNNILANQGWPLFTQGTNSFQANFYDILRQVIYDSLSRKNTDSFAQGGISRKLKPICALIPFFEDNFSDQNHGDGLASAIESLMVFYPEKLKISSTDEEIPSSTSWGWKVQKNRKILLPNNTEYGLLFDHRPSQVIVNAENLDSDSIIELNSGHRLIRSTDASELIGNGPYQKITKLPPLSLIHANPSNHLSELILDNKWAPSPSSMSDFSERSLYFSDLDDDPKIGANSMRKTLHELNSKAWSNSNTNIMRFDGQNYSISRFIYQDPNDESVHQIFWLRKIDKNGKTLERLILFDYKFRNQVPSAWVDYVTNSKESEKLRRSYTPLIETTRAFYSLSLIDKQNKFEYFSETPFWLQCLAPWSIRTFFRNEGGYSEVMKIDSSLAIYIDEITSKSLWLRK